MKQSVYMKVTNDQYELPVALADTPEELAEMLGVTSSRSIKARCIHGEFNFRFVQIIVREEGGNGTKRRNVVVSGKKKSVTKAVGGNGKGKQPNRKQYREWHTDTN